VDKEVKEADSEEGKVKNIYREEEVDKWREEEVNKREEALNNKECIRLRSKTAKIMKTLKITHRLKIY
jgi:hypothetical protein